MRALGSLIMAKGDEHRVPAGSALAVDREGFSAAVTRALEEHPLIEIVRERVDGLPEHPAIIAETRVDIPEASVGDAVMLMDLRNTGALMFRNSGTGAFNMVYRREDGTIGWVEPRD